MKAIHIVAAVGFARLAVAVPLGSYVVHTKRNFSAGSKWIRSVDTVDSNSVIPLAIALTQRNLENGYDFLMDVSDPTSQNYGQHWSLEKVNFQNPSSRPLERVIHVLRLQKPFLQVMKLSRKYFLGCPEQAFQRTEQLSRQVRPGFG